MLVDLIKELRGEISNLALSRLLAQGIKNKTRMLSWIQAFFVSKCVLDMFIIIVFWILNNESVLLIFIGVRTIGVDIAQIVQLKWKSFQIGTSFGIYMIKLVSLDLGCVFIVSMSFPSEPDLPVPGLVFPDPPISFGWALLFLLLVIIRTYGADFLKMFIMIGFFCLSSYYDS